MARRPVLTYAGHVAQESMPALSVEYIKHASGEFDEDDTSQEATRFQLDGPPLPVLASALVAVVAVNFLKRVGRVF